MFGVQDSLSSRITHRFLTVDEGDTVTSMTVTDWSMRGQSFPGIRKSSVLLRLTLRWCAVVQAEMSARHCKMCVNMSVSEDGGKESNRRNRENPGDIIAESSDLVYSVNRSGPCTVP